MARSQVVYINVIAHLLRNLEFVIKRSRNKCAMTGLNIQSLALWKRVSEGQKRGLLQRRMSLFYDSKESRNDIENSCKTQVSGAAATLPIGARGSDFVSLIPPPLRGGEVKGWVKISPHPNPLPQERGRNRLIHLFTYSPRKRYAFTLAEVLITLGIIGVVAAMTLPSLIANYKEKEIITRAKKDYSVIMQTFQLAQSDLGAVDNSVIYTGASNSNDVAKAFSKYITGGHLCLSNSKDKLCTDLKYQVLYSNYKNKFGTLQPPAIILPDNGVIFLTLSSQKCVDTLTSGVLLDEDGNQVKNPDGSIATWTGIRNACGDIYFDVNGAKRPNKFGYDAFGVTVWSDRIGKGTWNVYGADSLFSILTGGELKYNTNK